ncbi:MAG: hypothetical protein AAF192_08195 [Pseudomonadota bacterium]
MTKTVLIAHHAAALAALARAAGLASREDLLRVQTRNMTPEEIARRDRAPTRQERRAAERQARKARRREGGR